MKLLYIIAPTILLSGCKLSQWIVENEGAINEAGDTASGFGPYGTLVGLFTGSAVAVSKWVEHKSKAKDVVASVEKALAKVDPKVKLEIKAEIAKHMPSKAKKYVTNIKKKL